MIVDSSVILSLVLREPESHELLAKLEAASSIAIGAPTLTECSLVIRGRLNVDPLPILERFLRDFQVTVVNFSEEHWREAADAFARYGKGRHAARLNFGDCMSYAVAKLAGENYMHAYFSCYGLETVSLRYFNVFGPHQDPQSEYAAVVPKFITAALAGKKPRIFGDGEQSRDFCFIDNVVEAEVKHLEFLGSFYRAGLGGGSPRRSADPR